jgi:hypothetical protein
MYGGRSTLNLIVSLTFLATTAWPSSAWGHRLNAEAQAKKIQKVKVESWFDLGGVPSGARLQVFRKADNQLLLEHALDENGQFTFYADWESLRVVIFAEDGHQKELEILPEGSGIGSSDVTAPLPSADRSARVGVRDILAGVAFVLALAAFVVSVRNNRRLGRLEPAMNQEPRTK